MFMLTKIAVIGIGTTIATEYLERHNKQSLAQIISLAGIAWIVLDLVKYVSLIINSINYIR